MGYLVCELVRLAELVGDRDIDALAETLPDSDTEREREGDMVTELLAVREAEAAAERDAALSVPLGVSGNIEVDTVTVGETEAERLSDAAALAVARERDADRVEEPELEGAGERVREAAGERDSLLVPVRAGERLGLLDVEEEPVGKKPVVTVGATTVLKAVPGM